MTTNAELIKAALRVELEKQGSSLEAFEASLASKDLEKTAVLFDVSKIMDYGWGFANIGGLTAVGTGAGAGYLGYKAYKGIQDTDDQALKKTMERKQYEDATHSLMAAQQTAKSGIY